MICTQKHIEDVLVSATEKELADDTYPPDMNRVQERIQEIAERLPMTRGLYTLRFYASVRRDVSYARPVKALYYIDQTAGIVEALVTRSPWEAFKDETRLLSSEIKYPGNVLHLTTSRTLAFAADIFRRHYYGKLPDPPYLISCKGALLLTAVPAAEPGMVLTLSTPSGPLQRGYDSGIHVRSVLSEAGLPDGFQRSLRRFGIPVRDAQEEWTEDLKRRAALMVLSGRDKQSQELE